MFLKQVTLTVYKMFTVQTQTVTNVTVINSGKTTLQSLYPQKYS